MGGFDPYDQISPRRANPKNPGSESRLFFNPNLLSNLFFPSFFYSLLSSISSSAYSTVTSYLILNSTVTSSLITPCIDLAKFATNAVEPKTALTNLCRRRRRSAITDKHLLNLEDDENQWSEDEK